ncbi:MAG: VCBS repeat-containing protein, partial [Deltaproteobacteria bacterium]|nr:VCBS repeat-containing protein [Deltaproteobacteria bacterium]
MRLPTLALLAAMVAGCSRAPAPIPQSPPSSEAQTDARPVAASSETASSAPALYRLPASEGEPPAWWLPPAARVVMPYSLSRTVELAAAGGSRAILSSLGGLLVVDAKSGVVGTRAIDSQVEWLALDERDGLVAAREDGSLWRAPTWDAAMSPVGRVPGALRWDLAAGSIVAATSAGVMRSTDDGKSFASLPDLPRPVTHIEVFTRSDGVVVVQGKSDDGTLAAFSLRRRDRRWTAAPADVGQLERSGDWIADDGPSSCANVLSRDGIHWVETKDDREFDYWESLTSLDDEVQYGPTGPFITLGVPAAPSRRVPPCDDPGGVGGLGMSGVGGDGDEPLRGTTGPRPRPTTRWAQLFSDALSSGIDDDEPWVRPPSSQITRRPHVALWNEAGRTLRSVELPAACTHPLTIHDAAGAGVLRCEQPKSIALWTIGADGVWHAEGTLPVDREPPGTLTVADDGTMMLHGQCALNGPCDTSWLRVPKALGGSWRALPGGDTLAYRVLAGGRALQISGTVAMGYMLAVVDGEHDPLPVGKVEHDGRTLERLTIAADRTVRLRFTAKEGDPVEYALDPAIAVIDAPTTPPPADPILRPHGASGKVTAFGDYDGDGFDDLAIVRRNTDSYKGRVVIVRGMPTFGSQDDTQLQAEPNIEIGLDVRFYYVEYLGSAGDFNGDGYADLLISLVIPGPADELTAEAYVVWGRSTTEPRSLSAIRAGDGGVWIGGVPSWSRYQLKTRMIGDIDGDGRTDIGLSLAGAEDGRGLLYIVRGKTDAAWIHLGDVARDLGGYVLRGQPNENLGQGFAAIGDLDG